MVVGGCSDLRDLVLARFGVTQSPENQISCYISSQTRDAHSVTV